MDLPLKELRKLQPSGGTARVVWKKKDVGSGCSGLKVTMGGGTGGGES